MSLGLFERVFKPLSDLLVFLLLLDTLFNKVKKLVLLCFKLALLFAHFFKGAVQLSFKLRRLATLFVKLGMIASCEICFFSLLQNLKLFEASYKLGIV